MTSASFFHLNHFPKWCFVFVFKVMKEQNKIQPLGMSCCHFFSVLLCRQPSVTSRKVTWTPTCIYGRSCRVVTASRDQPSSLIKTGRSFSPLVITWCPESILVTSHHILVLLTRKRNRRQRAHHLLGLCFKTLCYFMVTCPEEDPGDRNVDTF